MLRALPIHQLGFTTPTPVPTSFEDKPFSKSKIVLKPNQGTRDGLVLVHSSKINAACQVFLCGPNAPLGPESHQRPCVAQVLGKQSHFCPMSRSIAAVEDTLTLEVRPGSCAGGSIGVLGPHCFDFFWRQYCSSPHVFRPRLAIIIWIALSALNSCPMSLRKH